MAQATAIEWTDVSWNPVHGCSKVSPGCAHCYAETLSRRYGHTQKPWTPANAAENVILKPHRLRDPLSGRKPFDKPCMVFVNSMSDLFHELIPDEYIAQVFEVMALAGAHTFQVLTKRPERMRDLLDSGQWRKSTGVSDWPLRNVWLGTSIENRRFVSRADALRETWAAIRFISAEPLLGPLAYEGLGLLDIDWLIVGGESGPGHRSMRLEWARDLRDLCAGVGTAFFMKQLGGARPGDRLEDLPEDLRIREFPSTLTITDRQMEYPVSRAAFTEGSPADRVLAALEHVGGGVTTAELAYQTGLAPCDVVNALGDLAIGGRVKPVTWTLGQEVSTG